MRAGTGLRAALGGMFMAGVLAYAAPARAAELAVGAAAGQEDPGAVVVEGKRGAARTGVPSGPMNVVLGGWFCLDSAGGLPDPADPIGRLLVLWPCEGADRQAVSLDKGVLYVGRARAAQVVLDPKPNWQGCHDRTNRSGKRFYTIGTCAGAAEAFEGDVRDPAAAVIRAHLPGAQDYPSRGRLLTVRQISASLPEQAIWEFDAGRNMLRVAGTSLCLTPPFDDRTAGAPLTLDDCDQPMMAPSGQAAASDGRARVSLRRDLNWVRPRNR